MGNPVYFILTGELTLTNQMLIVVALTNQRLTVVALTYQRLTVLS